MLDPDRLMAFCYVGAYVGVCTGMVRVCCIKQRALISPLFCEWFGARLKGNHHCFISQRKLTASFRAPYLLQSFAYIWHILGEKGTIKVSKVLEYCRKHQTTVNIFSDNETQYASNNKISPTQIPRVVSTEVFTFQTIRTISRIRI